PASRRPWTRCGRCMPTRRWRFTRRRYSLETASSRSGPRATGPLADARGTEGRRECASEQLDHSLTLAVLKVVASPTAVTLLGGLALREQSSRHPCSASFPATRVRHPSPPPV